MQKIHSAFHVLQSREKDHLAWHTLEHRQNLARKADEAHKPISLQTAHPLVKRLRGVDDQNDKQSNDDIPAPLTDEAMLRNQHLLKPQRAMILRGDREANIF